MDDFILYALLNHFRDTVQESITRHISYQQIFERYMCGFFRDSRKSPGLNALSGQSSDQGRFSDIRPASKYNLMVDMHC